MSNTEGGITDTIYSEFVKSATDARLMLVEGVLERMAASVGGHVMNLANLDHKLFVKSRVPNNFRVHIVYVAPSGFSKSSYFHFMLRQDYGLLFNSDQVFPVDVHSSFSVASWLGTMKEDKETGEWHPTSGVLEKYKRGMIGADDYQTLKLMFDGEGIGEDERALMTALDTDEAVKNLSTGQMRIKNVGVTCWFGMRPTKINLQSGLARRFLFPTYFPTRKEARLLRRMARSEITATQEKENEAVIDSPIVDILTNTYNTICETGAQDFELDDLNSFLDQWDIPHFEEKLYRTLAIGWSIANGSYPDIKLGRDGEKLIESELCSREMLRTDPFRMMFYNILSAEPDHAIEESALMYFLTQHLQFQEDTARDLIYKEKRDRRIIVEEPTKGKRIVYLNWTPNYLSTYKQRGR